MNRLKSLFTKMSDEVKELGKRFPLTMIIIVAVTVLATIMVDQDISKSVRDVLEKIYFFSGIWVVGTIFTESYFVPKVKKAIGYGLTGGISFVFTMFLTDWYTNNSTVSVVERFLGAYLIILILCSMVQCIKNEKLKFQEYVLKVFRDLFHVTVIYFILNIGMILITTIFVELILDGKFGSSIERIFILISGLFYVPAMVYTFSSISKKEVNHFVKGLILYVLLPLVMIAIAIIYLYLVKIIVLQDMPQNIIFRILAGIFVVAFPVWNMASNYCEEKKWIDKTVNILPYLFAPFLLLEMYSIGVRIREFGLTSIRYMACSLIVFQAICLGLTFYKKQEKLHQIFWYGAIIVFVTFVTPLNFEKVPDLNQRHILEKLLPPNTSFDDLSEEDKRRANSAYHYLVDSTEMPTYFSEEEKEKIRVYRKGAEGFSYYDTEYISLHCNLDCDIQKYTKIEAVSGEMEENTKMLSLEKQGLQFDFSDKINEVIAQNEMAEESLDDYFQQNNVVEMNDEYDLYISDFYFRYNRQDKSIEYLDLEGYLLQK